ncbi:MAG: hypothetical protein M1436_03710 [Acidobacteria bacterium]|nr:hypothetical protein [Acidobacteriota bacterium]
MLLTASAAAREVFIALPAKAPQVTFAGRRLDAALRASGHSPTYRSPGAKDPDIIVRVAPGTSIAPGGFAIRKSHAAISVVAPDKSGAMYGVLALAEQIRATGLAGVQAQQASPRFPFRAIKFNLPWSSYRVGESLQQHTATVRDLRFWAAFLDMMAENRFNVLTLWSLHPWPYMIRASNFPKACPFDDRELAEWRQFWHGLFAMARERGVDVYMVNWNVFVSRGFRDAYDPNAPIDDAAYSGPSNTTEAIKRYNRESVTQVLREYPDLAGIGITLGERMKEMTVHEQVKWVEDVYFPAIREARRPTKFIYRAALKANDPAFVRRSIENSGLPGPVWVELKFNASHGHSSTTLARTHGGGTGAPYWNPPPAKYKMAWMIRNEDIFMLRWGQPDFIREHIARNGGPETGGYFTGSETYIPAKEYVHQPGSRHVTWKYGFERQWLFYMVWGRLLYDPATPDAIFQAEFDRRYGPGIGKTLFRAFALGSRLPLRLASFYSSGWDFSLYSEGFLDRTNSKRDAAPFISIDDFIQHPPLDPNYVSIKDYVAGPDRFDATRMTPPRLADALEQDARGVTKLLAAMDARHARNAATLQCEIDDARTWAALSLYMADKIRAGVALATARTTGSRTERAKAVALLEHAARQWEEVIRITKSHLQPAPLMHLERIGFMKLTAPNGPRFFWENYRQDVERDIEIARSR